MGECSIAVVDGAARIHGDGLCVCLNGSIKLLLLEILIATRLGSFCSTTHTVLGLALALLSPRSELGDVRSAKHRLKLSNSCRMPAGSNESNKQRSALWSDAAHYLEMPIYSVGNELYIAVFRALGLYEIVRN